MYLDNFVEQCHKNIGNYEEAISYLDSRGLTSVDIDKYKIGYTKLGSVSKPKDVSEDYDYLNDKTFGFKYLREKIIIPLRNTLGHVNGLVTRDLHNDGRRYVIYLLKEAKRTGGFFGLYEALPHIQKTGKVFVHEGAINAISFAKVFPNTISSLTSFINEPQFELLDMIADKIILVFDNDKAGKCGVDKMIETYGTKKIDTISLGESDANDYLKIKSGDDYIKFITQKVPFMLRG